MISLWILISVAFAIFLVSLRRENPTVASRKINVQTSSPHLDKLLNDYKDLIAGDFQGYRNHIYRVLTYTLHFLDGDSTQDGKVLKYLPVIEAAIVYHDIGLWTDRKLSYLEPSTFRAKEHFDGIYSEQELRLLHNIIYWHHKITPFIGDNDAIVNAVRKADWIDATFGLVNYGMSGKHIQTVNDALPEAGFHATLAAIGPRYYGYDIIRIIRELSTILKW